MSKKHIAYIVVFLAVALWSFIQPYGYIIWFLEVSPCIVGIPILAAYYKRFKFTNITYFFILIFFILLLIGAHYTYSRVPAFDWLSDTFGWHRNNFDKLAHFAQGFVPALITREILIRQDVIRKPSWMPFIVVSVCLAISAAYELFEWGGAVFIKQSAEDFLGMQGYQWDTQSDMLCAMLGAIVMLITLSKVQDKQIARLRR